jgi:hypothetical protein
MVFNFPAERVSLETDPEMPELPSYPIDNPPQADLTIN